MSLGSDHSSFGNINELHYCFFELFKRRKDISLKELENRFFKKFSLEHLDGLIYFFSELKLIKVSKEKIIPINKNRWPKKNSKNIDILNLVIKQLEKNDEIDNLFYEGLLKFDEDGVAIRFSRIPQKYNALRDLLSSLKFFKRKINSPYHLVDEELLRRLPSHIKVPKKSKLSQEALDVILNAQKEKGEKAELWVLQFERNKYKKTRVKPDLLEKISKISDENANAGYDLESLINEQSTEIDKFIEVKALSNGKNFFWSPNELSTSRRLKNHYYLYIVDVEKINEKDYVPVEIKNPAETILEGREIEHDFIYESSNGRFTIKPDNWKVKINK